MHTKRSRRFIEFLKRLFGKKKSLRERCIEAYGEEFGRVYDALNSGQPVGGFMETYTVLDMIEKVKQGKVSVIERRSN